METPKDPLEQPIKIILPLYGVEANRAIANYAAEEKSKELQNRIFGLERARELVANNRGNRGYHTLLSNMEDIVYQEVNTKLGDLPLDRPDVQDTWTSE